MIQFRKILYNLLIEGRVEDFKKKYETLPDDIKNRIIKNDPSNNNKYLDWMGKIAYTEPDVKIDDVIQDVNQFDKFQASLGDINKFKTYNDLKHALSSRQKSNKEKTREGATVLIDNDEFLVVVPTTHDSCRYYGNNTKWCIVGSEDYWEDYYYQNTIIIVLDRRDNEKYAVVGNSDYGNYDVYDKNDHSLNYNSFTNLENDDSWPEYVQEAIEDAMGNDNVDSRQHELYNIKVKYITENYGNDYVWKNYIARIHKEYKLEEEESLDIFKNIANERGFSNELLHALEIDYLYYNAMEGAKKEDVGDVSSTGELESNLIESGKLKKELNGDNELEYVKGDYVRTKKGIMDILKMVETSVGESVYDKIYYKGTLDDEVSDAIIKYNNMLNSKSQMSLTGIETKNEKVQITSMAELIYVLNKTGHENIGGYLQNVTGLKESVKPSVKKILL